MALWFVSYATSPTMVIVYDVSIVIVYDVTLLLSMTYQFKISTGKTDCTDLWVIKLTNQVSPSIGFRVPHFAGYKSAFTLSASTHRARRADIAYTADIILSLLTLETWLLLPHAGLTPKKNSDWLISLSRFKQRGNYWTNSNTCSCRDAAGVNAPIDLNMCFKTNASCFKNRDDLLSRSVCMVPNNTIFLLHFFASLTAIAFCLFEPLDY